MWEKPASLLFARCLNSAQNAGKSFFTTMAIYPRGLPIGQVAVRVLGAVQQDLSARQTLDMAEIRWIWPSTPTLAALSVRC